MEIIPVRECKTRIAKLIVEAKDSLFIVSYSLNISNPDLLKLYDRTTSGVNVTILTGKLPSPNLRERLELLPRLKVLHNPNVHAKIYMNEEDAIISSCNFSELNIPKLYEIGVYMKVADDRKDYNLLQKQVDELLINADTNPILKTSSRQLQPVDLGKLVGIGH